MRTEYKHQLLIAEYTIVCSSALTSPHQTKRLSKQRHRENHRLMQLQLSSEDPSFETGATRMTSQGRTLATICICLQLFLTVTANDQEREQFTYGDTHNGPHNWGALNFPNNTRCSHGRQQSPITITPNIMVTNTSLGALDAHYTEDPVYANIKINEGFAVEIGLSDEHSTLQIDDVTYIPKQMHFHMGSEHKILGHSFPMELHLVHIKKNETGHVIHRAVVAFLFVEGREDNPFLAQFVDRLPRAGDEAETDIPPITYPKMQKSYARYQGSLTTPPCTEDVVWTVMLWDFPTISRRQLELFKAAMPTENARPSQPAHGRMFAIHGDR